MRLERERKSDRVLPCSSLARRTLASTLGELESYWMVLNGALRKISHSLP